MKILFDGRVLRHKNITGVERYAIGILKHFKKLGIDISILSPNTKSKYFQHLWEHTILSFKSKDYDILFCPSNIAPIWKPKNIKLIVTIHDLSYRYFPNSYSKLFRFYYRFLIPKIIENSDKIITVSNVELEQIVLYYPKAREKIVSIYNGIDSEYILEYKNVNFKKGKYILYVGSLNQRKNLQGLAKAFLKIHKAIDCKLVIIGTKIGVFQKNYNLTEVLQLIPSRLIEFKGQINDQKILFEYYKNASLFVLPSFYEACSFAPLEAMASGCPIVASNIAALKEECGDAAYYVDPYSVESIAEGIYKVLTDETLRQSLIQKGLERARLFSWEKSAREHLRVFEEVLNN